MLRCAVPLIAILAASGAHATEEGATAASPPPTKEARIVKPKPAKCPGMQEQVTLNINFNSRERDIAQAKAAFEKRMADMEAFAKKAGVQKFEMNNMNYNISAQMQSSGMDGMQLMYYQMNGNLSYQLDNADVAAKLMEQLTGQGVQSSMSVNSYRQQPCNYPMMAD